jgi:hypothetical protein
MSIFMDGYSTNSQERREAEADARHRSDVRYHEECCLDHFYSRVEMTRASVLAEMTEHITDAFTTAELGELIRAALRDPAMVDKFSPQIEAAAYAYATRAAE